MTAARVRGAVIAAVIAVAAAGGARAAHSSRVGGDFLRYHRAGRLVATGRAESIYDPGSLAEARVYAAERAADAAERGADADPYPEAEFKYLPATAVMMAPLGALHPRTAWTIWGAWNGALVAVTLAAAWAFAARGAPWRWLLVPALVLLRVANDNQNLGQLNPSAIAPATVALWALDRGRDRAAGALAGFGAVVKFYPAALGLWFALKRRWAALAALGAGVLVAGAALPAVVLGPGRAADLTGEYLARRAVVYTEAAPPDLPGHSVKSFVYRVFGGVRFRTGSGAKAIVTDVSVARADPAVLRVVVLGAVAALGAFVALRTRGPLRPPDDPRGPLEAGMFLCWLLLASPEARSPHFLYLAIPVAALTATLLPAWRDARAAPLAAAPRRRLVLATALAVAGALLVNAESESLLGRDLANHLAAWCVQGWGTACLLAACAGSLLHRREEHLRLADR